MYQSIVVGTDGSASAQIAVDAATELARLTGATLHVVHAHKVASGTHFAAGSEIGAAPIDIVATNEAISSEARALVDRAAEPAQRAGVTTKSHCVGGDPVDALLDAAEATDADLVVVGNRGMTGVRRLLGSVPSKLSHHCPASILIVDTSAGRAPT
jgi:nucleotide-binding universal stress UspA family protein